MEEKESPRLNSCYDLHVHSARKRLVDIDGISAKAAIDGLVNCGLLSDDSSKQIRSIKYTQEASKEESTTLTFTEVE